MADGLFVAFVRLGEYIRAGEILGILRDEVGNISVEVRAERSGIVAGLANVPLLRRGDRAAYIG